MIIPRHDRENTIDSEIVESIGINKGSNLLAFYIKNEGIFCSKKTGFCLLDLTSGEVNIITQSKILHEVFNVPAKYLAISDYLANSVLIYDVETEAVYNVDFEGGIELLIRGEMEPQHENFSEFLDWYFGIA